MMKQSYSFHRVKKKIIMEKAKFSEICEYEKEFPISKIKA